MLGNKIKVYRYILLFVFVFISLGFKSHSEVSQIIDNYNKSSFASNVIFDEDKDKALSNKLYKNVYEINKIVNFKKYHAIVPMVIRDSSCPNAFATTANNIYVCAELVSNLSNCELRYVVAHEIAHIVNEDFINSMNRGFNNSDIDAEINFHVNKNRYSRIQEIIADRDAVVWTLLSGCHEKPIVSAAKKLFHGTKLAEDSTHPSNDYRIRTVKDKAKSFYRVKNNNISDFQLLIDIKDYKEARITIEEYISYNLNDLTGYMKRIELNYLLLTQKGLKMYKNAIVQDCKFLKDRFAKKNSICDNIK